jgi:leader peptidase (prepilin peptidase)/N-methyltransferase
MEAALLVLAGMFGLAVGSFLNVCIDRLPRRESVVATRSHCDACGRQLSVRDLVPVVSYVVLRGRCRSCGASIPRRVLCVELLTGAAFAGLLAAYGPSTIAGLLAVYACILIVVFFIDLEHGLILNVVVYPSVIIALLAAVAIQPYWLGPVGPIPLVSALVGAGIGFIFLFLVALLSRGGMGWGDVKFAAFMGAALGFPLIFVALFSGIVVGGVAGAALLISGRKSRKQSIPFGPFLVVGTMAALLWGQRMLDWYLGLM